MLEWNVLQRDANILKSNRIKEWTLIPTSSSIKMVGIHKKPSKITPCSSAALSAEHWLYCKSSGSRQQNQSHYTRLICQKNWIGVLWRCISPRHLILPLSQWQLVLSHPLTSTSLPSPHTHQPPLSPLTQHRCACQGPGGIKQERKRQLRLIPKCEAAVAAVEGGREPGRLLGLEKATLTAPLWLQKPHLGAYWSAPILPGALLQTNKRLHPALACSNKCLFIATDVYIQGCHALSFMEHLHLQWGHSCEAGNSVIQVSGCFCPLALAQFLIKKYKAPCSLPKAFPDHNASKKNKIITTTIKLRWLSQQRPLFPCIFTSTSVSPLF